MSASGWIKESLLKTALLRYTTSAFHKKFFFTAERRIENMDLKDIVKNFNINAVLGANNIFCHCGRRHTVSVKEVLIERGAVSQVPGLVRKHGGSRPYLIADRNTFKAAGEAVCGYMQKENLPYSQFVFELSPEPDELAIGRVAMQYDTRCDFILGVGSGTMNDISKIIAHITGLPYMIVGTAPSMDGYASATSSVIQDGIKHSLNTVCPTVIVADLDIMCKAPLRLLRAGLGDMLAKYVSICEWRLSHLITGEYYCEEVASIVRGALNKCVSVEDLSDMNPETVKPIVEGLIISGMAMDMAGLSRPASGMEHYFSHLWDMRSLEFHTPSDLHGIQCGVGTLLCLRVYQYIRSVIPNRQKAMDFVRDFQPDVWNRFLVDFLGKSAQGLIEIEKIEKKYDPQSHQKRLEVILGHWDDILQIISEELPGYGQVEKLMQRHGMPVTPEDLGHSDTEVRDTFIATKDIRDKYIASRLLWDLGLLDEAREYL